MRLNQTVSCSRNTFQLMKVNVDCYYTGVVMKFETEPVSIQADTHSLIVPTFNVDHNYFTPAFSLPVDTPYYQNNLDFEKQKFQDRIQIAKKELSNQELIVVNPNHNYCQICKNSYSNYTQHLKEKSHFKFISKCKANQYIQELSDIFQKPKIHPLKSPKSKIITKITKNLTIREKNKKHFWTANVKDLQKSQMKNSKVESKTSLASIIA